jgi:4-amino-4-deoxy-L-arabinose transferase-like glycosyltransferase
MAIAIGLGGLTKGPIVLGVPLTTLLALRVIRPKNVKLASVHLSIWQMIAGLILLGAVVAPWCYLVEKRCPGFLTDAFHKEVIDRSTNPQEGHSGPPGYYLLTIWAMFFPWSLFLPATLISAWKNRRSPQVRFALAAAIGPWLMLELVRTKLPHYLLPAYPFLAFLTADLLVRVGRRRIKAIRDPAFVRIVAAWAIVVAIAGALPWIAMRWFAFDRPSMFGLAVFTVLAAEYGRNVYVAMRAARPLVASGIMGVGMFVLVIILHVGFLPAAGFLQVSRRVAEVLKANGATTAGDEIMIDYKEPSLAFYQGGTIREESRDDYLATVDPIFWPRWIVVTEEVWEKTPAEKRRLLEEMGMVRGWDYAGKGVVEVKVMRRMP